MARIQVVNLYGWKKKTISTKTKLNKNSKHIKNLSIQEDHFKGIWDNRVSKLKNYPETNNPNNEDPVNPPSKNVINESHNYRSND